MDWWVDIFAKGLFNTLLGVKSQAHQLLGLQLPKLHPLNFHRLGHHLWKGVGGRRGRELKADGEAQKILRITYKQPVKVKLATFYSFLHLWGLLGFYFLLPELVFLQYGSEHLRCVKMLFHWSMI